MCTNYRPGSRDLIRQMLEVESDFEYPAETWPAYRAPVVCLQAGQRVALAAQFGLIPTWCKSAEVARRISAGTLNARAETVADKPAFRTAFRRAQFCLVPMQAFYEPCYESGRAVRWRVAMSDGMPFCAAGLWSSWLDPATQTGVFSFSLLTLNADGHAALARLHKPDDEKRSLFIVPPRAYDKWLSANAEVAARMPVLLPPEAYVLEPAPRRVATAERERQADLF